MALLDHLGVQFADVEASLACSLRTFAPVGLRECLRFPVGVAVAAGVEVLYAPRFWPEHHPGYDAVFLRDPDGHDVEAVHHGL